MTDQELCRYYLNMTKVFHWAADDPQHHDNRCPIHAPRLVNR